MIHILFDVLSASSEWLRRAHGRESDGRVKCEALSRQEAGPIRKRQSLTFGI